MQRGVYLRSLGTVLATLLVAISSMSHASPVGRPGLICVQDRLNVYLEQSFIRGLRGVGFNSDPFSGLEAYALLHCAAGLQVTIKPTEENADLKQAETRIVYMIANAREETFEDVVENLRYRKFDARIDRVPENACYCEEEK